MIKNYVIAAVTVVILGLAVAFQVTSTTSHENKDGQQTTQTTDAPDRPATNDQSGKPGEVKGE